jgi:hypothetical protein
MLGKRRSQESISVTKKQDLSIVDNSVVNLNIFSSFAKRLYLMIIVQEYSTVHITEEK